MADGEHAAELAEWIRALAADLLLDVGEGSGGQCGGHAQPQVEPLIDGWFAQEARDHNHLYQFMHLDDVVNWVFEQRLFSSFRAACEQLQLPLL